MERLRVWPYCPYLDDSCLLEDSTQALGPQVHEALLRFVTVAEDGAHVTLQRNQEGFSMQIVGPMRSGESGSVGLDDLKTLRHRLDRPPTRAAGKGPR